MRWAAAGHEVWIGSRQAERGAQVAGELNALLPASAPRVRGGDNLEVTEAAEVVVMAVPYQAQRPTRDAVAPALYGQLLTSVIVPHQPTQGHHVSGAPT